MRRNEKKQDFINQIDYLINVITDPKKSFIASMMTPEDRRDIEHWIYNVYDKRPFTIFNSNIFLY
jgi:hypothetical protein